MSRKSRRNISKNAAEAKRTPALRLPYSTLGLSSLALGSMAIVGAVHAQDASPAKDANTSSAKPKSVPVAQQAKTLRSKVTRLASTAALPQNGAGLLAQTSPAGTSAENSNVPAPTNSADQLQEIVVTGIRGSLERALQIKRMSLGVVDAISAEDIGQFPDSSIGEAVGRIPGVTVDRGSINQMSGAGAPTATGSVTGITVRGFGEQFNELLVEGRPLASGNGQSFDWSTMSANYIGEVDVHKTPDFSLSSGAVGATVNVKFPNPFDNPGMHVQGFVSTNDDDMDGGFRPAFGALFSDTFADGKFGILIDGDYTDRHILGHHQDVVGWKAAALPCSSFNQNYDTAFGNTGCALVGSAAAAADAAAAAAAKAAGQSTPPQVAAAVQSWYPQDMAMYLERTDSRRKDGRVALQWRPVDNVVVTFDDNYSSDEEHTERFQRSTWFGVFPNGATDVTLDGNSTVTNFSDTGPTDFNTNVSIDYIVTNTPGINVLWDVNDDWTAELDADQSVSKLNPNGSYSNLDVDVGYGDAANNTNYGLVLSANPNVLPYWSAYGPGGAGPGLAAPPTASGATPADYNGLNPFIIGSHVLPIVSQQNSDKINQVKLDATWHAGSTKVNFGMQFVDDTWNSKSSDTFTNNYWQLWSGYGPASNNTSGVPLQPSMFSEFNVGTWMPGYSGNGNLPQNILMYNAYTVLNYLINQPVNPDQNANAVKNGYPAYVNGVYPALALSNGSVQHVDRANYAPFITAQQNVPIGDMTLKVNAGLRYVRTDETIAGLSAPLQQLIWLAPGDPTAYSFVSGSPTWTEVKNSYHYVLPSLDLNLLVRPDIKVRADFSRTESPPNNANLIPNTTYGGRVDALTATGHNAALLPYLSDNYDLGAEWYYARNDYLSVDGFFKHVTQFPVTSEQTITVPGIDVTAGTSANFGKPATFSESTLVNGLQANVTGIEATWQQMLFWGFGFTLNGTYAHTNRNFNNYELMGSQFALPGIGNSANFDFFYQEHGLQARLTVHWQGDELISLAGQEQNGGSFAPEPVYLASSTNLDFSTQYDLTSHVNVYFEALNLTDTIYHTYGRFKNQTLNLVDYGRSYTIGVRAKF
ncbi:MAG TPA: TonB-dependent receptor [Steroidobacteraceae bacterium]